MELTIENRFRPGDIVQHFKRETLSDEERAAKKYPGIKQKYRFEPADI